MKKFLLFLVLPFVLLFSIGVQNVSASDGLEKAYFKMPMRELIELGIMEGIPVNGKKLELNLLFLWCVSWENKTLQ